MSKVALLVPRAEMLEQAEKIAQNYHLDFLCMKAITTTTAQVEANKAVEDLAEIIIARGVQATLIKKCVKVPVVEILMTGQEMGQLIVMAKTLVHKPRPTISIVGFRNMFCDMSSFDKLYNVNFCEYYVEQSEQLLLAVKQACDEKTDIVIGGDIVCQYAKEHTIPSVFLMSGTESIAEAFRIAEKVSYAIGLEKKNTAEFKALLDYSFNGIIKIDSLGIVLRANHFAERLLEKSEQEMMGQLISSLVPHMNITMLDSVLGDGQEIYSTVFMIGKTVVVSNIAPILFEGHVQGAIISFHEGQRVTEMEAEIRGEFTRKGYFANHTFEMFVAQSSQSKAVVERAKSYAKFNAPILILGNDSTESELLAQCIHNDSICSSNSFVSFTGGALGQSDVETAIFGSKEQDGSYPKSLVDWAKGGTLFLDGISRLDYGAQSRLYELIKGPLFLTQRNDKMILPSSIRVIASDTTELISLVEQGKFRRDLFCALNVLPLTMVPLQERKEDIRGWIDSFIDSLEKKYKRYIRFTTDAYKLLQEYSWSGNLSELYFFCERLIILSPRRTVNDGIVRSLMNMGMMPENNHASILTIRSVVRSNQETKLRTAIEKHNGNRRLVAQEMNISLTTLWRYMKKYGIYEDTTSL